MLLINCKLTHWNVWWYFWSQTNKLKLWAGNPLTELDSFWNWGWIELASGNLFEDSTILADKEIRFVHWTGRCLESRRCSFLYFFHHQKLSLRRCGQLSSDRRVIGNPLPSSSYASLALILEAEDRLYEYVTKLSSYSCQQCSVA